MTEPQGNGSITPQSRITVADRVVFQDLGGEAILLNLESGQYYGLDEVGSRIWSLLTRRSPLHEVHRAMLTEYEVDASELECDIVRLVSELLDHGLVAIDPEDTEARP